MNEQYVSSILSISGLPLLPFDSRSLLTTYTNVFRASGSAEELILDFGFDAHRRTTDGGEATVMLQRLALTWGPRQTSRCG